jgi:hypothetical protein
MNISTKARSLSYRFTIDTLSDKYLQQLKLQIKNCANELKANRRDFESRFPQSATGEVTIPYVRVRARGSRKNQFSQYHTLIKNATHYDVYINQKVVKI